jgi:uroporphyrinogen-III synthase
VLAGEKLTGRRVGVQLPPDSPPRLADFLHEAGALPDPVMPYAYVPAADPREIAALIEAMSRAEVDAIAFTSAPQVARLFDAAASLGQEERLMAGLRATPIAAIGPVVAAELRRHGLGAAIMPQGTYFMKPLVSAIAAALSR